ncbi:MAG: protein kinase [Holophagaceae bacterium]
MIGQVVSHYRILEQLGEGGMGVVYKAEDLRLGRKVALKFLPAQATRAEEARERFLQEARHASSLDHPNIAAIHAIEEGPDGGLFIVMALVEGRSLRDRLRRGPLPWTLALPILEQVLAALAHAHARGLVHRDIKPANIMLGPRDEVKVVDFGLAKAIGSEGLTRTGVVMGTVQYLSPEQVGGKPVDPRSDLWAAGMVLHEMLTGHAAFRGDGLEATFAAILHGDFVPPSAEVPGIPPALDFIVARALERDPRLRYPTAERFLQDLKDLEGGATATLPMAGSGGEPTTRSLRPARAGRGWVLGAALAVAAGLVAYVGWRHSRPAVLLDTRVAVVPFEDRTGDPAKALLGRQAAERVCEAITQTGVAEAAQDPAALPFDEGTGGRALQAVAERHRAGLVVTGAYHLEGGDIQVQARIYDARLGKVVALVKPEHGPAGGADAVLQAAAQRLAGGVAGRILDPYLDPERVSIPPRPEAYREWLLGWELYWNARPGAEACFEKAAALDPELEVGRVPIAFIRAQAGDHDGVRTQFDRLDRGLERMSALDRCIVENGRAWLEGRSEAALGPIREAARIAPGSPLVNHQHAFTALYTNHFEEAVAAASRPIRWDRLVNPRVPIGADTQAILAWAQHLLGRYGDERGTAERALAVYPEQARLKAHRAWAAVGEGRVGEAERLGRELSSTAPVSALEVAMDLRVHGHGEASRRVAAEALAGLDRKGAGAAGAEDPAAGRRMLALALAGRLEESLAAAEGLLRKHPGQPGLLGHAGMMAADLGRREEARRRLAELAALPAKDTQGRLLLMRARVAARLGETGTALALLQQATAEGQQLGNVRHLDWAFEGVLRDPGFQAFLQPRP